MFDPKIIVADFKTSLAAKMAAGATTGSIVNNLDDDGVTLPTGKYYFTLDADSTVKEHLTCTLTGKNMTDIKSVSRQGVETPGIVREHRIGATVSITDFAHIKTINDFASQYDGKWESAVANYAALVALPSPSDGEARVTLDDSKIYVYDLDTFTWNLAGAGGGAGTVYVTTLMGTDSWGDHKTFSLNSGSFPDKKYLQVYKNGVLMSYGAANDYVTAGNNKAVFNDVVLDDDVITLLVVSVDLYNPAWNSVNDDMLPDITESYSIGSALKKFTTAFFSGIVTALSFSGDGSNLDDGANGKLTSGTTANKLVRLDGSAKLPAVDGSQLTNAIKIVAASDALLFSNDAETSSTAAGSVVLNSIYVGVSGTYRVKFDAKRFFSGITVTLTGGSTHNITTSYATYTADVYVLAGQSITITGAPGGNAVDTKNFRLYGYLTPGIIYAQ